MKNEKMKKESDTEMLARLVVTGFNEIREDIQVLKNESSGTNDRLDRIEYLLMRAQENRLDKLEDKMRRVETVLEI